MTDATTMTLEELNEAICWALSAIDRHDLLPHGIDEDGAEYVRVPDYAHSLDALAEPERVLIKRDWTYDLYYDGERYRMEWYPVGQGITDGEGTTEAERAALEAERPAWD